MQFNAGVPEPSVQIDALLAEMLCHTSLNTEDDVWHRPGYRSYLTEVKRAISDAERYTQDDADAVFPVRTYIFDCSQIIDRQAINILADSLRRGDSPIPSGLAAERTAWIQPVVAVAQCLIAEERRLSVDGDAELREDAPLYKLSLTIADGLRREPEYIYQIAARDIEMRLFSSLSQPEALVFDSESRQELLNALLDESRIEASMACNMRQLIEVARRGVQALAVLGEDNRQSQATDRVVVLIAELGMEYRELADESLQSKLFTIQEYRQELGKLEKHSLYARLAATLLDHMAQDVIVLRERQVLTENLLRAGS